MIKLLDNEFMGAEEMAIGIEGGGLNPRRRGQLAGESSGVESGDLSEEGPEDWDESTDEDENEELAESASRREAEDEDS